jgi:hypothetical protein
MNLSQVIPMYNWSLTERFFKELDYLEGRDYRLEYGQTTVRITFKYTFQFSRYWAQWGKHIAVVEFN